METCVPRNIEELVEQLVLLAGDEEGHGFVIFGRYTVCPVALACTKEMMKMALE